MDYSKITYADIEPSFLAACSMGNMEMVKFCLKKQNLKTIQRKGQGFVNACRNGHLETVIYLTKHLDMNNFSVHHNDDEGFKAACEKGQLEVVKYLTRPEIEFEDINHYLTDTIAFQKGILPACNHGQLNIVEYLFTLRTHYVDMVEELRSGLILSCTKGLFDFIKNLDNSSVQEYVKEHHAVGLDVACKNGHLNLVKYLAAKFPDNSKEILEALVPASNNLYNNLNVFEYLLFEKNCHVDLDLKKELKYKNKPATYSNILHLIDKKDLFEKINKELPMVNEKKIKIKI